MRSSGAGGGALVRVGTASAVATNFTGTGLAPATPYDHRVAGPDGAGGTTSTRCASITTTPIAPPSGLTAVSNGPDWIDRT